MDQPTVSVCMVTYGHEAFIAEAIDGVLMQECDFDVELIIGNDASPDNTDAVIRNIIATHPRAGRIRYLNREKNLGMMQNFLDMLQVAKGEFIALCDGDDFWTDPTKLAKQVAFLKANPDYVMTYHDAKIVDSAGNLVKASKLPDDRKRDFSREELMTGIFVLTVSMCFRNVLREFPPEFLRVVNGDSFLTSMLGQYGKGKYLAEIQPSAYRLHEGGVWGMRSFKRSLAQRETAFQLMRYHSRQGNLKAVAHFNNRYFHHSRQLFSDYLSAKEYRQFFKAYFGVLGTAAAWKRPSEFLKLHVSAVKSFVKSLGRS